MQWRLRRAASRPCARPLRASTASCRRGTATAARQHSSTAARCQTLVQARRQRWSGPVTSIHCQVVAGNQPSVTSDKGLLPGGAHSRGTVSAPGVQRATVPSPEGLSPLGPSTWRPSWHRPCPPAWTPPGGPPAPPAATPAASIIQRGQAVMRSQIEVAARAVRWCSTPQERCIGRCSAAPPGLLRQPPVACTRHKPPSTAPAPFMQTRGVS